MITQYWAVSAPEEHLQPILSEAIEIAIESLKKGKSAKVDNILAIFVQAGGETIFDVLTEICNTIWRTGEWPTPLTQSLIITRSNKTCHRDRIARLTAPCPSHKNFNVKTLTF